jgi:branched-chain amino acid transport system substrate-binding protein
MIAAILVFFAYRQTLANRSFFFIPIVRRNQMKRSTQRMALVTSLLLVVGLLLGACVAPVAPAADSGAATSDSAATTEPVKFFVPVELSGAGATAGTNWRDGLLMAQEDVNAAGGILGRQVEFEVVDTQSDPTTSKAVIAKGLEAAPYAVLGPLFSGSIIVNMVETQRAETTQIMGGEAANLTEQGSPFIFRTSFGQTTSMPKIATHMQKSGIKSVSVIWVNNDFGKGGHDNIIKALEGLGVTIAADISTEQEQADFAAEVLTAKESGADALFAYLNEAESAKLLTELSKQGYDKPIYGETVLLSQSVLDLAKEAANGVQGHVGLSVKAPVPSLQEFGKRFEEKYGRASDHNGIKGYISLHFVKEITERLGTFDTKALAEALHCTTITTEEEPGVLMNVAFDDKGNVDRESFLVEIKDGKQEITQVLPMLGGSCGAK